MLSQFVVAVTLFPHSFYFTSVRLIVKTHTGTRSTELKSGIVIEFVVS